MCPRVLDISFAATLRVTLGPLVTKLPGFGELPDLPVVQPPAPRTPTKLLLRQCHSPTAELRRLAGRCGAAACPLDPQWL